MREAFGAVVALYQAEHATDPALAALFAGIAADEAEHAALSFDLADWLESRLSPAERAVVSAARARALSEVDEAITEPSLETVERAGHPSARVARSLLRSLAPVMLAA